MFYGLYGNRAPGRPGAVRGDGRRAAAPARSPGTHRVRKLRQSRRHGRHGLAPDQQVRRGLPRTPLLRRLRVRGRGRGSGARPGEGALRRGARQRAAPLGRAGQHGGLLRAARAGRYRHGNEPVPRRAPDPRKPGQHVRQVLPLCALRRVARDGAAGLRPGARYRPHLPPQADCRRRERLSPRDRLRPPARNLRRGGREAHGGYGAHRGPRGGGGTHEPDPVQRRGHDHHAQDPARPARRYDPVP